MFYKDFMINDTVFHIRKFVNDKKLRYYLFTGNNMCLGVWDNPRMATHRAKLYIEMDI